MADAREGRVCGLPGDVSKSCTFTLDIKELTSPENEPAPKKEPADVKYHAGDSIDFNVEKNGQGKLFG